MEISAQLVKQLREMTDAGMMDCKKALVEVGGDIQKAVEYLREKGLSKAAKKADRVASEGVVSVEVASDFSKASLLEINQNIAKIGENIVIRRLESIKVEGNAIVNGYVHSNGRVGVLIAMGFNNASSKAPAAELARSFCMHAAAMKPQVLSYHELDSEFIQKEKVALIAELSKENEEFKRLGKPLHKIPEYVSRSELTEAVLESTRQKLQEDLKAQGKPEQIWDKIIPGQMERFISDNTLIDQRLTLLGQFFVMDDKKTIAQVLEAKSKELGDELKIIKYVRFELGEGIEKKVEDFAAEVAAQMQ